MESKRRAAAEYIKIAAVTALIGNAVLAVIKIGLGFYSGSRALLGDGVDSSADVLISVITLAVAKIISRPADLKHPWGHGRAETIATAFLSFVIFFVGAQLIFNSVSELISGDMRAVRSGVAVIAAVISIIGKSLLAVSQYVLGRRSDSAMIKANAKNMSADVVVSAGVLAGLLIGSLTGSMLADTVIAVLIGAWVIKTAIGIFLQANLELMDGGGGAKHYLTVFNAVKSVEGAGNPHRVRMRRIAGFWDIDIDIEVDPVLTVLEAHVIACSVEEEIRLRLENVFDIVVHVEPSGHCGLDEGFGLSENQIGEEKNK